MFKTFGLLTAALLASSSIANAQLVEPGGRSEDIVQALTNPDEFAWKLFFFLNHQAAANQAGVADAAKKDIKDYDADKPVVWETWALASGVIVGPTGAFLDNKSEVYKKPATAPVEWKDLDRKQVKEPILTTSFKNNLALLELSFRRQKLMAARNLPQLESAPLGVNPGDQEVRMNQSTYNTIRSNRLFSVEGLEAAAQKAKTAGDISIVKFEAASKEIKAQWFPLPGCEPDKPCADKDRYHWRIVTNTGNNKREVWGLVSLHIVSKDLPNWFWADFGHIDCETGAGACAGFQSDGSSPLRDSTTGTSSPSGQGPSGSGGKRNETLKSKWENYRLRGTQIDFATAAGRPTILSSPVIEDSFQKSSCIACHALATVGIRGLVPDDGSSIPRFLGFDYARNLSSPLVPQTVIGNVNCVKYLAPGTTSCPTNTDKADPVYFQSDFLWSMPFRAFSER